ncbi:hypothetical protein [Paenibacillus sp. Z6-24]
MNKFIKSLSLGIVAASFIATSAFASINSGYIQVLPSTSSETPRLGQTPFVEGVGKTGKITLISSPSQGTGYSYANLQEYCNGNKQEYYNILTSFHDQPDSKNFSMKSGCTYRLNVYTFGGAKGYINNGVN